MLADKLSVKILPVKLQTCPGHFHSKCTRAQQSRIAEEPFPEAHWPKTVRAQAFPKRVRALRLSSVLHLWRE